MPILLVPSNYEEGKTRSVKIDEVEGKNTEGVLVETTMGEVSNSLSLPLSRCDTDERCMSSCYR